MSLPIGFYHPCSLHFLPDITDHTPQRRKSHVRSTPPSDSPPTQPPQKPSDNGGAEDDDDEEVTFFQDFVAGGLAGSASIAVGHPFDTIKVRVQSSGASGGGILNALAGFGGFSSLFRGMGPPVSSAAFINAIIFSSYGAASKVYDQYLPTTTSVDNLDTQQTHDPWYKSMLCGAFAGFVQCFIICPMEHLKCRLQVQHGVGAADHVYRGPVQAAQSIVQNHGFARLYQGWWCTFWREIPAFGFYFATYDMVKDKVNTFFSKTARTGNVNSATTIDKTSDPLGLGHTHTWVASALAGGCAGSFTWAVVYPLDVIKTRIQTAPLTTPNSDLRIWHVGQMIVRQHGWAQLFRGFGVTILRAFPVNGTVFPVYEFTLLQLRRWQADYDY